MIGQISKQYSYKVVFFVVPRAIESELTIDNMQTPGLEDKDSSQHRVVARSLEEQIKYMLFTRDVLEYGPADIDVKVTDLM